MALEGDDILDRRNAGLSIGRTSGVAAIDGSPAGVPPTVTGSGTGGRDVPVTGESTVDVPAGVSRAGDAGGKEGGRKMSYEEMFRELSPYSPPSDEQLDKERRKRKREALFSAIGDGISALSNLYFTSRYAPDSYDVSKGMASKTKARFDKLKKDREDNQRQYMEGLMRARKMDEDSGYRERMRQAKDAADNISIRLKEADLDLKEGKLRGQDYLNRLARLKAEAYENGMPVQAELLEEKIKTEKARQARLYRQGGGGRYPWYDSKGNRHYAGSYEEMRQNAIDHGTWMDATEESVTDKEDFYSNGKSKGASVTRRTVPAKGHSIPPAPAGPPAPVGGNGKKEKNKPDDEKVTIDWE